MQNYDIRGSKEMYIWTLGWPNLQNKQLSFVKKTLAIVALSTKEL